MIQRRKTIVKTLFVILFLISTTGCRLGNTLPPTPAPLALDQPQVNLFETHTVQRGDIAVVVTFPGTITLRRQTELFFEQEGRVKTLNVQSGDFVRADAVLGELDIDELQIQLTEAEWDLEIIRQQHAVAAEERTYATQLAKQQIRIAELRLASLLSKELDEPGSVPPETMAEAEHALTAAQLELKRLDRTDELEQQKELITAEVRIRQLRAEIDRGRIIAPFAGNIYFLLPREDLERLPITPYEPVMRLVDPTSVTIEAAIADSDLELLSENAPASIALQYRPGVTVTGTIEQLPFPFGTGGDPFVYLTMPESEQNRLRVGGAVDITVEAQRQENVLWLPPEALQQAGNNYYALVQTDDTQSEVQVQVGLRTEERVEILAGLVENDIVLQR